MYKYEFGHIIECEGKRDEEIQKVIGEVRQMISDLNGRIVKEDVWGKRELTYPINKQNHGFYMFTTMMMEPFATVEFEKKLKLLDGSMRYLLINLDKEPGYAKQIAADEGDDEKIKTRKPVKEEDEEEKEKSETKGELKTTTDREQEKTEKKPAADKEKSSDSETEEPAVTDKAAKKSEQSDKKEESEAKKEEEEEKDEEKYDELLDKKLSEIL